MKKIFKIFFKVTLVILFLAMGIYSNYSIAVAGRDMTELILVYFVFAFIVALSFTIVLKKDKICNCRVSKPFVTFIVLFVHVLVLASSLLGLTVYAEALVKNNYKIEGIVFFIVGVVISYFTNRCVTQFDVYIHEKMNIPL